MRISLRRCALIAATTTLFPVAFSNCSKMAAPQLSVQVQSSETGGGGGGGGGVTLPPVEPPVNYIQQPYTIGAWYFTAWSSSNDAHPVWTQNAVHRYDPWGGVRDNFLSPGYADYSPRKPQIGFYDQMDQRVMDTHIQQAASRGLSYFAFYWFWDETRQEEAPIETPIHRFLSSPYKGRMKFMITPMRTATPYAKPRPLIRQTTSLTSFKTRMVPYIVNTFFADPSYLTTTDGRPVITDWDFGLPTEADHRAGIEFLKSYSKARLGKEPLVLYLTELAPDQNTINSAKSYGADGFQCFQGLGPNRPGEPYPEAALRWPTDDRVKNELHVPCTSAGFDGRPWCLIAPWNCDAAVNGAPYPNYMVGNTPEAFGNHLKVVKKYLDDNAATTMKMLTLYAWNEWGEGGDIEPDVAHNTAFVDAVQNAFGLKSVGKAPAPVNLEAVYPGVGVVKNPYEDFITNSFKTMLGRNPSSTEMTSQVAVFTANAGMGAPSKAEYLLGIYDSPEYQGLMPQTAPDILNFWAQQTLGRALSATEIKEHTPHIFDSSSRRNFFLYLLYQPEHAKFDPLLYATMGEAPPLKTNPDPVIVGTLDGQLGSVVVGWTCDSYDHTQSLIVDLYRDLPYDSGGVLFATVEASRNREAAVADMCSGIAAHGFIFDMTSLAANLKDGQSHKVYAYAHPLSPGRAKQLLNLPPRSIDFP